MDVDLRNRILTIFGLNFSGKSYLVKKAILSQYRCIVYDPMKEYPSDQCDVFYPTKNVYPGNAFENESFIKDMILKNQYELLIYDEANRIFPTMKPLFPVMRAFLDAYRHHNQMGLVFICRRASQIFADIPCLSHNLISFGTKGTVDVNRLNAESKGLGDTCSRLAQYNFCFVNIDRSYFVHPPI